MATGRLETLKKVIPLIPVAELVELRSWNAYQYRDNRIVLIELREEIEKRQGACDASCQKNNGGSDSNNSKAGGDNV